MQSVLMPIAIPDLIRSSLISCCRERQRGFRICSIQLELCASRDLRRCGAGTNSPQSRRRKPWARPATQLRLCSSPDGTRPNSVAQFAADSISNTLTRQRENIAGVGVADVGTVAVWRVTKDSRAVGDPQNLLRHRATTRCCRPRRLSNKAVQRGRRACRGNQSNRARSP